MNTPRKNPISTIGDKIKKVAVGAALLGTLTACNMNEGAKNEDFDSTTIEQNDGNSDVTKYREDYDYHLKAEGEIDDVFNNYLNEEELQVKQKMESREAVKKEYLRLKSLIGKEIYAVEIESYPGSYPIYCNSKQEYDKLLREYNTEKKHYAPTEMEAMQETATPMKPFILTEKKLVEIIKEYATHPWIMPMEMREIWSELLERQE